MNSCTRRSTTERAGSGTRSKEGEERTPHPSVRGRPVGDPKRPAQCRTAGVSGGVAFADRDIRELSLSGPPGIILCNPPYGVRIRSGPEAEPFYRAMGEAFKRRCAGWTAYVLSGNPDASRHIGLKASRKIPLMNGPIDCRLLRYELS